MHDLQITYAQQIYQWEDLGQPDLVENPLFGNSLWEGLGQPDLVENPFFGNSLWEGFYERGWASLI